MASSNNYHVEAVSTHVSKLAFGEAPFWSEKQGKLIYPDCFEKVVCALDLNTRECERHQVDLPDALCISVAVPYSTPKDMPETDYLVVSMDKIYKFNSTTKALTLLYEHELEGHSFDDGKCDTNGRLWTGAPKFDNLAQLEVNNEDGILHCFDGNYKMTILDNSFKLPNGMAWSADNNRFFCVDMLKRVIWVYDYDANATSLTNKRILFDFNNDADYKDEKSCGVPDGLTMDLDGNLYCALWEGGRIAKICTNTGKLLDTIHMPVPKVTSLCFGGNDYTQLLVTTATIGLDKINTGVPDSGKIFRVTPKNGGHKGFAQNCFVEANQ